MKVCTHQYQLSVERLLNFYGLAELLGSNGRLHGGSIGDGYPGIASIEKGLVVSRRYKISSLGRVTALASC
jgi:hypothetical protein